MRREEKMDEAVKLLRDGREADRLRRAEEIVAAVKALDVASFEAGTRVEFTKSFGGRRTYEYLALKVTSTSSADVWYITGRAGSLTDEEFEEFLAESGGVDTFDEIH